MGGGSFPEMTLKNYIHMAALFVAPDSTCTFAATCDVMIQATIETIHVVLSFGSFEYTHVGEGEFAVG